MRILWLLLALLPLRAAGDQLAQARLLHARTIVIDSHIDTMQRVLIENLDLGRRSSTGHVDLPRLREGGVSAPFFALWVPTYYHGAEAVRRTLQLRDAFDRVARQYPDQIALATTAAGIERLHASGRIAAILTIEGGHQIDNDLAVLRMYYQLGIRAMTLTHFQNNDWADSSTDQPAHNGLTDFGRQVVREMNRLGMLVDLSHVSDKTFYDALAVSTQPVIVSHSACRALSNVPRNVTDEMLRALARNGGVIGINFGEGFLNPKDAAGLMSSVAQIQAAPPNLFGQALDDYAAQDYFRIVKPEQVFATVEDAAAHVDHAVKVAGIDHVGIGSDFDGISGPPHGLEDISKLPNLTAALLRRGYSPSDLQKILGGNFLRVLRQVCK